MQKTKPPVDMQHVCKYTEEIIEKLKKKKWKYTKSINTWVNPSGTCGFLHHEDSFKRITETSNDKEFITLPKFSHKTWKGLEAIYYASNNNNVFYGIVPELVIEIIKALNRKFNKTIMSNIVFGFPSRENVAIMFVPYKGNYARFVIAPKVLNDEIYRGSAIISGHSYKEPYYLFYDIKTDIIGPLYKGKIITMDDYKEKWVVHILSNS